MNYEQNYYDYANYVKQLVKLGLRPKFKNDDKSGDYEFHHILPKSLGGGEGENNVIPLTYREHYLAHYLFWKFNKSKQAQYAFWCMNSLDKKHKRLNTKIYERVRKEFLSNLETNNIWVKNHSKGNSQTKESNKQRSETIKQYIQKNGYWLKGRKQTPSAALKSKMNAPSCEVIWLETGEIFRSIADAVKTINERLSINITLNVPQYMKECRTIAGQNLRYTDKKKNELCEQRSLLRQQRLENNKNYRQKPEYKEKMSKSVKLARKREKLSLEDLKSKF